MAAELLFPKLVIFGASGPTGRHLVQQALNKGHLISAVVRSPDKFDIRWVYGLLIVFTKVSLSYCSVTGERANVRTFELNLREPGQLSDSSTTIFLKFLKFTADITCKAGRI